MNKKTPAKPEKTYKTKITYMCPVRGKVTEEVEVKVYSQVNEYMPQYPSDEISEFLRQEGVLPPEEI